jgi:hypothetical protein
VHASGCADQWAPEAITTAYQRMLPRHKPGSSMLGTAAGCGADIQPAPRHRPSAPLSQLQHCRLPKALACVGMRPAARKRGPSMQTHTHLRPPTLSSGPSSAAHPADDAMFCQRSVQAPPPRFDSPQTRTPAGTAQLGYTNLAGCLGCRQQASLQLGDSSGVKGSANLHDRDRKLLGTGNLQL